MFQTSKDGSKDDDLSSLPWSKDGLSMSKDIFRELWHNLIWCERLVKRWQVGKVNFRQRVWQADNFLTNQDFEIKYAKNGKLNPETGDRNLNRNIAGIHQITQKQVFKLPNPTLNTPG